MTRLAIALALGFRAAAALPAPGAIVGPHQHRTETVGDARQRIIVQSGVVVARITTWQCRAHADALAREMTIAADQIAARGPHYHIRLRGRILRYSWTLHGKTVSLDVHGSRIVLAEE